jgi:type IV pilus assembly protein PilC
LKNTNKLRVASFLNKDIGSKKIDTRILSLFLKQLSLLLNSGISLDDSLRIIESQNLNPKLTKSLSRMIVDIDRGESLYVSFLKEKEAFNPLTVAFIKSGDESGNLGEILDELSKYMTEDSKNKSQIKEALLYPIILLLVTILVVIAILTRVMPTFVSVFENSGQSLPKTTLALLAISNFIKNYGLICLIIILFVIALIFVFRKKYDFRLKMDKVLYKSKFLKNFRNLNMEYQISSLLYILKKGDIDIIKSIEIIKNSFKNEYLKAVFDRIKSSLEMGENLSQALEKEEIFSQLFISMVKVGEDSGKMTEAMEKSSRYFSNEYLFRLSRMGQVAEPLMIIIMAIIVGFVVFSVALPMFDSVNMMDY